MPTPQKFFTSSARDFLAQSVAAQQMAFEMVRHCPVCDDPDARCVDEGDNSMVTEMVCSACGAEWSLE